MKKFVSFIVIMSCCLLAFFSCTSSITKSEDNLDEKEVIKIGVTASPHGEILNHIKQLYNLYNLQIINYFDYEALNRDLLEGKIHANFFQTREYLDHFNSENTNKLVEIVSVHIEPLVVYSKKYKSLDLVEESSQILIPNDYVNKNRALKLLEKAGLIRLNKDFNTGQYLISENPKSLIITEVPINTIPSLYEKNQYDLIVLNTNFALESGIFPHIEGIYVEEDIDIESKSNLFVTRKELRTSTDLKEIGYYLNGYEVRKFINENYRGFVKPVF